MLKEISGNTPDSSQRTSCLMELGEWYMLTASVFMMDFGFLGTKKDTGDACFFPNTIGTRESIT